MKSKLAGKMLVMTPGARPGSWEPASVVAHLLLRRIQRPRAGDPAGHPARDRVDHLIAQCATRGVAVVFDPLGSPPSPARGAGQGSRRNGRHHR